MNNERNDYTKIPSPKFQSNHSIKIYLSAAIMTIFFGIMGILVFIVTHNPALMNDEYKVSIWYIIQSLIFYLMISLGYTRNRAFRLWKELLPWRMSGLIGSFWAINYVCILVAGPYLPNAIQTLFAQSQTVIVYLVNYLIFHNELLWYHHAIIGSIITFNLATSWGGGFESTQSPGFVILWSLIFIINALAAGLANNLLEAFFVAARVQNKPKHPGQLRGNYDLLDYVLAINAIAGVWSLVTSIVLVFIPLLAYRSSFKDQVFLTWDSFTSVDGQLFIFSMGLTSWIYTIISYVIIAKTTALWMTVASQIATIFQLVFLAYIPWSSYRSVPTLTLWINNIIVSVISVIYSVGQPDKEQNVHLINQSIIGKYYTQAFEKSSLSNPEIDQLLGN